MEKTMEANIVRFTHLLRLAGIKVGSGEVIDALNALTIIDISHREQVKTALRAVLVKRKGERDIFDHTFDLYFAPLDERERHQMEHQMKQEQKKQQIEEAEQDLQFEEENLALTEDEKYLYSQMDQEDKGRIKDYLKKAEVGKKREWEPNVKSLVETIVKGALRKWLHSHREQVDLKERVSTGDQELDYILEDLGQKAPSAEESIMYEDMQHIKDKDLSKANMLIRRLAKHLVTRISRRYKRSKRHQLLDLRRTIRDNIRYGGTMFKLKYRSKRIQKPKLILLCDVSGSMARYASLVLQFMYGIHSVLGKIESFIFSDDLERISQHFQPGSDFNQLMVDIMNKSKIWGGGTRLHNSLKTLRKDHSAILTSDAYLIILSDTKTEAIEDTLQELRIIKKCVKDILWLNTLPEQEWLDSISTRAFLPQVKMYPCNTLNDIEKLTRSKIFT